MTVDGKEVDNGTITSVPVNRTSQVLLEWTAVAGEHLLEVVVDPSDSTVELNESNNRASVSVEVSYVEDFPSWSLPVAFIVAFFAAILIMGVIRRRR